MKICFLSPIYPIASDKRLGIFVHEQAKYIKKKGHEVHVITLGYPEDKSYEKRDGVIIHRVRISKSVPFRNFLLILLLSEKLILLNKKYNFDIINAHFVGRLTILIGIITKFIKKPLILTAYGIGLLADKGLGGILNKVYLSFPIRIVCVSNYVAKLAEHHAKKNMISVINLGVDTEKLKPTKTIHEFKNELGIKNEKVLLSIAGLVPRKGIDIIIKSLPIIIKSCPKIRYFVIGRGSEKGNLHKLVNELKLEKYVVFIEYVSEKDLANYYNICDIFILMSRTIKEKEGVEGLGMVYMEAAYMGKPVIAGKSGGTGDAVIDGLTGYRIKPTDKKEVVNKVVSLLKNYSLRKRLGSNGKKRILKELVWEHYSYKLIKVYESVLKEAE